LRHSPGISAENVLAISTAQHPFIAAARVKTQRSKLFLDLPDAHRRCIALLNAELNRFAKRIDQVKSAIAASDSPAHAGLLR